MPPAPTPEVGCPWFDAVQPINDPSICAWPYESWASLEEEPETPYGWYQLGLAVASYFQDSLRTPLQSDERDRLASERDDVMVRLRVAELRWKSRRAVANWRRIVSAVTSP